jgi:hypothetical protein
MCRVTFADFGPGIASSRLRAQIPQRELKKLGINQGNDVLVYGKHGVSFAETKPFQYRIYDICDDHFHSKHETYYREHAGNADLITVNSEEMARVVSREVGREAIIIPDPYESDEQEAGIGDYLFWFGHESNLQDLEQWLPIDGLRILTGNEWSREKQITMLKECSCVILPTGKSMAKSANRLIEAVRNGRYVIAGELPAHEEFKPFMSITQELKNNLQWFRDSNPADIIQRIRDCQAFIRDRYSPGRISRLWLEAINQVCH